MNSFESCLRKKKRWKEEESDAFDAYKQLLSSAFLKTRLYPISLRFNDSSIIIH